MMQTEGSPPESQPEAPHGQPPQIGERVEALHWPSAWQLGLGLLALLTLWGLALVLLALGLLEFFNPTSAAGATSIFLLASGMLFFGFLILPSIGYSYGRLFQRPFRLPGWLNLKLWSRGILLLPIFILIGHFISSQPGVAWLLLPPLHVLALGLPIIWLFWQGSKKLKVGGSQRAWGVFGLGLVAGPLVILALEAAAAIIIIILGVFYISSNPALLAELLNLAEAFQDPEGNLVELVATLESYLANPVVSFTIFAFVAGMVPIIEEAIKPIGVWLLPARTSTPAMGFVAGLLSGAGYALFENLALSSQAEAWALAVSARAATSLLHMTTAGIMGWGLVLAWRYGKFWRLILVYLVSVSIHGLWNGFTLLTITNVLDFPDRPIVTLVQTLGLVAPAALVLITISVLVILFSTNRRFRLGSDDDPGSGEPDLNSDESSWPQEPAILSDEGKLGP